MAVSEPMLRVAGAHLFTGSDLRDELTRVGEGQRCIAQSQRSRAVDWRSVFRLARSPEGVEAFESEANRVDAGVATRARNHGRLPGEEVTRCHRRDGWLGRLYPF